MGDVRTPRWLVKLTVASVLAGANAYADEAELRELIERQEQRIAELERKLEALAIQQSAPAIQNASAPDGPAVAHGSAKPSQFIVTTADGAGSLRLRGLLHFDGRYFEDDVTPGTANAWVLRRARPSIEGSFARLGQFRFTPEFGGGRASIIDASLTLHLQPTLAITAGKFKVPVGLERLMSASDLRFIERGFPTSLVPNRDLGLQVGGDVDRFLSYNIGYFNGVTDGGSSESNEPTPDAENDTSGDWAARIFLTPFAAQSDSIARGLGFGIGATYTHADGSSDVSLLPSLRTPGQQVFFRYRQGSYADGRRVRLAPQLSYYLGPLGVLAEYTIVEQEVTRDTTLSSRSDKLETQAWQLQFAWMASGEREGFSGHVAPTRPFSLDARTWGAVELVARYHRIDVDDAAFAQAADSFADATRSAQSASAWGLGINWYFTAHYTWSLTYDRTSFDGGSLSGDREDESVFLTRFGVVF